MSRDRAGEVDELAWPGVPRRALPLVRAGVLIGLGVGTFVDGIVLHGLLGVHTLLSGHPDPSVAGDARLTVVADALLELAGLLVTLAGVAALWRAWRTPGVPAAGQTFLGSILGGWGLYLLLEGVIAHHVLTIHHVWPAGPGAPIVWDLAYLACGAWLLLTGVFVVRGDHAVLADSGRARRTP